MERTHDPTPSEDRAQRERLELVQVELRAAQAALATASGDAQRAETALRSTLAEADARHTAAKGRLQALAEEREALEARRKTLKKMLEDRKKEEAVLDRGATYRDEYVEWKSENWMDRRANRYVGTTWKDIALIVALVVGAYGLIYLIDFWTHR